MILDIDVGNTRIKWRFKEINNDDFKREGYARTADGGAFLENFQALSIDRIRVSSVVANCDDLLVAWAKKSKGITVEFARVRAEIKGIKCGYTDPSTLGIDRWVAILAASRQCKTAFAVIDAGSALTVDLCDQNGRHLGGYIVPGLSMMMQSLGARTSAVGEHEMLACDLQAGTDTPAAVVGGCVAAIQGVIATALAQIAVDKIFITGGDGEYLTRNFSYPSPVQYIPSLVLDGLAEAVP